MTNFDCKDLKALLSGLIDGELDDATRHQAERHLVDCKACRDLVNEAESLNTLLSMEAQQEVSFGALPTSFENAVLRQTVYAEAFDLAGRRWTSWLGWVAAAACLMLASSLWFVNRQMVPASSNNFAMNADPSPHAAARTSVYSVGGKSFVHDGGLPADALVRRSSSSDDAYYAIDEQLSRILPINYVGAPAILSLSPPEPISDEDADTLFTASNLLHMLARANLQGFADVERIRQIAEYDDLLERLAEARTRLNAADRAVVMAAESVLLRLINGPISLDDLHALHDTAAALDLPHQIEAISERGAAASTL